MDNLSNDLEKGVLNSRRERAMAANNVGCGAYAAVWGIPTVLASMMGGNLGVGCVMWGIALAITIVLNRQIAQDKKKTAAEFDSQTSARNQFIAETLQSQNEFTPIREIRDAGADFSIAIDPQHKKWLVILPPQKVFHLYAFQDLINYELSKDGKSVVSGNSSEAFLGGLLFGAVGAAAGASASFFVGSMTWISRIKRLNPYNTTNTTVMLISMMMNGFVVTGCPIQITSLPCRPAPVLID